MNSNGRFAQVEMSTMRMLLFRFAFVLEDCHMSDVWFEEYISNLKSKCLLACLSMSDSFQETDYPKQANSFGNFVFSYIRISVTSANLYHVKLLMFCTPLSM